MNSSRASIKRSLDDDFVSPNPKKQKIAEDSQTVAVSTDEADNNWKLLNGYVLWLNQFYNGHDDITLKTISMKLLGPLFKMINKINFNEVTNIWCDSKLLFELIKRKCGASHITISEASADFPPKIGDTVYKSSNEMNRSETESVTESSDYPGVKQHVVKIVHLQHCRVEKRIGYTQQEMETYSCILGLKHSHTPVDSSKLVHGWVINPKWTKICAESITK